MRREQPQTVGSPPTFWLGMAGLGVLLALLLNLNDAPLWAYYVAPVTMVPFLIRELLRLDAEEARGREPDRD